MNDGMKMYLKNITRFSVLENMLWGKKAFLENAMTNMR